MSNLLVAAWRSSLLAVVFSTTLVSGCKLPDELLLPGPEQKPTVQLIIGQFDTEIRAGDYANVAVSYADLDPEAYTLEVEITDGARSVTSVTTNATSAAGSLNLRMPVVWSVPAGSNYYVSFTALSRVGGFADRRTVTVTRKDRSINLTVPIPYPVVSITGIPQQVRAGEYLDLKLTQSSVNFNTHTLTVYLAKGADRVGEVVIPAGTAAQSDIRVPVDLNAISGGTYVVGWEVVSKVGGRADLRSAYGDYPGSPLAVQTVTPPSLRVASYPTLMNAGEYVDVEIDYSNVNFATHKLHVGVRNTAGAVGFVEITEGAATARPVVRVPIWWDAIPGSGYFVEAAAVDTVRDGWDDPQTLMVTATSPAVTIKADPPMPRISFLSVPQTVRAGEFLTVGLRHAGINFTTHELLLYLHNPDLPTIELNVPASADSDVSVKLPIQWATPVGTKFQVEWVLLSRSGGFDDLRSISQLNEPVISVLAPAAVPPALAIASVDPLVSAGGIANATVDYSGVNFSTHDLYVALVNADGFIAGLLPIAQPTSGRKSVQISVAATAPAGVYDITLAALPKNNKSLPERVSDPTAAIVRGQSTVEIKSDVPLPNAQVTFQATSVKAGDYLNGSVAFQNVNAATHQLVVYVASGSNYFEVAVPANGSATAPVKLPIPWTATPGINYVVGWAVLSLSGGWSSPHSVYQELSNLNIAIQAPVTPAPLLQVNSYSTTVKAGMVATVKLTYFGVNFATHKLHVDITNGTEVYGRTTFNAASGLGVEGTVDVLVEVDTAAVAGGGYYYQVSAVKIGASGDDWNHPMSLSTVTAPSSVAITR